jgi:hypothetical protein
MLCTVETKQWQSLLTGIFHGTWPSRWASFLTELSTTHGNKLAGRQFKFCAHICPRPVFRGDFSYDLGDLLPAAIGRQAEMLKLATKSANDWKDEGAKAKAEALKTALNST